MARGEDLFEKIRNEGERAIEYFIDTQQSEELFLDFKRSADNGAGNKLHNHDRQNLAKAISGFGNSEGGIIVWGIECSRDSKKGDVACSKVLIQNPKRFLSWLEGAVSGCTIPPHPRVSHIAIESNAKSGFGYVVTLIPKSYEAPHQCTKPVQYYIRVGSDFVPAPHSILSGLFGRKPQPFVFHMWSIGPAKVVQGLVSVHAVEFEVGLMLSSWGPGLARDLYVNLTLGLPGDNCKGGVTFPDTQNWKGYQSFGIIYNLISNPDFRLSPHMLAHPLNIFFRLEEPFTKDLYYKIIFGCSESPARRVEVKVSGKEISEKVNVFLKNPSLNGAAHKIVSDIMGIEEKDPNLKDRERYYEYL